MLDIDERERSCRLFLPNVLLLAYYSGPVLNQGSAANLVACIAQVTFAVMTALGFFHCAFYSVEHKFGLYSR